MSLIKSLLKLTQAFLKGVYHITQLIAKLKLLAPTATFLLLETHFRTVCQIDLNNPLLLLQYKN